MTSHNIEVSSAPRRKIKIMKAICLLSLLFVCTVILFNFNVGDAGAACECVSCHGVNYHGNTWPSCSTCHGAPPATGSHAVHSAPLSNTTYGDTVTNTAGQYQFGCGHCHTLAVTTRAAHETPRNAIIQLSGTSGLGQTGEQVCSECHGNEGPHGASCGTSNCTSCHSTKNIPHEAGVGVPVGCQDCHVSPLHNGTVPTVTNSCGQCHGASGPGMNFTTEQLLAVTVPTAHNASPLTMNCQVCHTEIVQEMHPDRNPGTPNDCSTCHISIHRNTQVDVRVSCGQCHGGDSPAQPNTPYFTVAQLDQFVYNFHNAIPGGGISWSADSSVSYKINFTALGCREWP